MGEVGSGQWALEPVPTAFDNHILETNDQNIIRAGPTFYKTVEYPFKHISYHLLSSLSSPSWTHRVLALSHCPFGQFRNQ